MDVSRKLGDVSELTAVNIVGNIHSRFEVARSSSSSSLSHSSLSSASTDSYPAVVFRRLRFPSPPSRSISSSIVLEGVEG